jgi:hypothetical protein
VRNGNAWNIRFARSLSRRAPSATRNSVEREPCFASVPDREQGQSRQ